MEAPLEPYLRAACEGAPDLRARAEELAGAISTEEEARGLQGRLVERLGGLEPAAARRALYLLWRLAQLGGGGARALAARAEIARALEVFRRAETHLRLVRGLRRLCHARAEKDRVSAALGRRTDRAALAYYDCAAWCETLYLTMARVERELWQPYAARIEALSRPLVAFTDCAAPLAGLAASPFDETVVVLGRRVRRGYRVRATGGAYIDVFLMLCADSLIRSNDRAMLPGRRPRPTDVAYTAGQIERAPGYQFWDSRELPWRLHRWEGLEPTSRAPGFRIPRQDPLRHTTRPATTASSGRAVCARSSCWRRSARRRPPPMASSAWRSTSSRRTKRPPGTSIAPWRWAGATTSTSASTSSSPRSASRD